MEDAEVELMLAWQQGDTTAFEKILSKYEKPLLNFIYRFVGDRQQAEDLTEEVFLRVYAARKNYQGKGKTKFSTWLYKIAANLCIDYQRKYSRSGKNIVSLEQFQKTDEDEIPLEIPDSSDFSADVLLERKQIGETIKSALLSLPENQRLALTLLVYEGKSYQKISEIIGCSISAVESLIFRARQKLKQKLSLTLPITQK